MQFLAWILLNMFSRRRDGLIRGLHFDLVLSPGINCFDADVVVVHALFHRLRELAAREKDSSGRPPVFHRAHRRAYYSLLTWLERRIYSGSRASLVAVSGRTASLLKDYFRRDDVRVIPNGVDAEKFSPSERLALREVARCRRKFRRDDFVLLLIGNDWRNKGVPTVLAAMAAMRNASVRLLVAGHDATASFFYEAAETLGLREQCRWETASRDALDLYAAADAYVSPTREDSFGLPILEAMACELPVITSICAGACEIITDNQDGLVLRDPNDAVTLVHHLRSLQQDPGLRRLIGENARRTAEAYTWERNAAATWEFLNEVVSEKQT